MDKIGRILIVDDDDMVLDAMQETFVDDYDIVVAQSGTEAIRILSEDLEFDTVILDIRMARMDGLKTADRIKEIMPELPIIFHTGHAGSYSQEDIDEEYQPFDFVTKNEPPVRLRRSVRNAVTSHRLSTSAHDLIDNARSQYYMVGKSKVMREVYSRIELIGPTDSKVMILGPTGSGKELVARALHKRSRRADQELRTFSCNHKNQGLVEDELFGHIKGGYTDAHANRTGMFELADGGTLFLDEIGDLDLATQTKILRVIETGELMPVGSSECRRVNVRLICATHHDLADLVELGRFRSDLYFRLKGVTIRLPALKDRREDITDLMDYFIERCCREQGYSLKVFEPAARALLIDYDWPGSVRQLADTVQSLIYLSPGYYITQKEVADFLNIEAHDEYTAELSLSDRVREFKRTMILQELDRTGGNVAAAARQLKTDQANLRKIIHKLGIEVS